MYSGSLVGCFYIYVSLSRMITSVGKRRLVFSAIVYS